jgi:hypothetical protein
LRSKKSGENTGHEGAGPDHERRLRVVRTGRAHAGSDGQLAIWLEKARNRGSIEMELMVLDALPDDLVGLYQPAPELWNAAVCFSRTGGFVFRPKSGEATVTLVTA